MIRIRPANDSDRDAIWEIFQEVVTAGDTYPFDPRMSREDALAYWFGANTHTYVAERSPDSVGGAAGFPGTVRAGLALTASPTGRDQNQLIVGTYILKPNQSAGGAHVANAAFMVPASARGQGMGRAMGEHCLNEARRLGFRAMQFNFVVSTNDRAVKLWQDLGMKIVGTLPGAFRHPEKGDVDVYVMFQSL